MAFILIGVNHKTCPLETREKFFLQPAEKDLLLAEFKCNPKIIASFILSTCNRTEIYVDQLDTDTSTVFETFFRVKHLPPSQNWERFFYVLKDEDVVRHLLHVVAGLDSLILGEKQILGQVKEAFAFSREKKMMSRAFNILGNIIIETGRKARRETDIDSGGSSISWAAVVMAQEAVGSLTGRAVLVMGAGKMGYLAIQQLKQKGADKIYIMNRTDEKAEELARQCDGVAVPFWKMREILEEVDVCICSTGAPHYLIEKGLMEAVMAKRPERKLVAIDIAVPRNISPAVSDVPGVTLLAVDDLSRTVQVCMCRRSAAVVEVEKIISAKTEEFYRTLDKAVMYELLNTSEKLDEAHKE